MAKVLIFGEIHEEIRNDGQRAIFIDTGDVRLQCKGYGPVAETLHALESGQWVMVSGDLVDATWQTQRGGSRHRLIVRVLRVKPCPEARPASVFASTPGD